MSETHWAVAVVLAALGLVLLGGMVFCRLMMKPFALGWIAEALDLIEGQDFRSAEGLVKRAMRTGAWSRETDFRELRELLSSGHPISMELIAGIRDRLPQLAASARRQSRIAWAAIGVVLAVIGGVRLLIAFLKPH